MIDLDNFPTSPAAKRMMKTISPIYDKAYVGKWIFQVMGLEMDEAWEFFEELRLQAFPETATWGIVYWEQRYHIPPDDNMPIEERRRRVIIKRSKRSPMNPTRIEQFLKDVAGRTVTVTEQEGEYVFLIYVSPGENDVDFQLIVETVKSIKPSHLSFEVIFKTETGLVIDTRSSKLSFNYRLCGTFNASDEERWTGRLLQFGIGFNSQFYYSTVSYPLCGTFYAGGEAA